VKHFDKVDDRWQVKKELQKMISFQELNLMEDFESLGHFDIVFCRNVLIYFDVATKQKVLSKIKGVLAKDGVLFIGCAESMVGISDDLKALPGGGNAYGQT
jgi:chemotaxis protein methyltransferase CheR